MRLLVTGGSGVLGRALRPLADAAGHAVRMPSSNELDVFDPVAVAAASRDVDAVLHLATRIQSLALISQPDAWRENDRLRAEASRILVDAALAAGVEVFVQGQPLSIRSGRRPGVACPLHCPHPLAASEGTPPDGTAPECATSEAPGRRASSGGWSTARYSTAGEVAS